MLTRTGGTETRRFVCCVLRGRANSGIYHGKGNNCQEERALDGIAGDKEFGGRYASFQYPCFWTVSATCPVAPAAVTGEVRSGADLSGTASDRDLAGCADKKVCSMLCGEANRLS
jgi:hypothetical protein